MASWYDALKNLNALPDGTDKTDITHRDRVSSVLSVTSMSVPESSREEASAVSSVLSVRIRSRPENSQGGAKRVSSVSSAPSRGVFRNFDADEAVTLARLRNDPRLAVCQADPMSCLTCGRPGRDGDPLVPVLSPRSGAHIWVHRGGCHARYRQQMAERAIAMTGSGNQILGALVTLSAGSSDVRP